MKEISIFGAGAHAKVLIDCIEEEGKYTIKKIYDDHPKVSDIYGYPIFKRNTDQIVDDKYSIIAITNCNIHKKVAQSLSSNFAIVIHPTAVISKYASIGKGSQVFAGCIINASAVIGKHCIINTGTVVEHDCVIGDFVHLSPNTSIGGGVKIGAFTQIGIGASIIQNIKIGSNVIVGAGAVVISDIPNNCTAVGIPAKPVKFNDSK